MKDLSQQVMAKLDIILICLQLYMYTETFKWVVGPWMECSSPCDGGVRYRDVGCYGSISDASIKHYPVDDGSCSSHDMVHLQYKAVWGAVVAIQLLKCGTPF